jgi:hypothetical protein
MRQNGLRYEFRHFPRVDVRRVPETNASDLLALAHEQTFRVCQVCSVKKEERDPLRISGDRHERIRCALSRADAEYQAL